MWEYKPWADNQDNYWFGQADYNQTICFPGFSPFYSYGNQYPDNPSLSMYEMAQDIWYFFSRLSS